MIVQDEISLTKVKNGVDGGDGKDGIAGKDGVGIKNTTFKYGVSTSGTTKPSNWSTTIPTVPEGQFLWTETTWTYTDNTNEKGYSVAKQGAKGDPTGVITSDTEPNPKFVNTLWKHTGSVPGFIKGGVYRWNGSRWDLFIFIAENISASSLSAISANLGTVTAGTLKGTTILSEFDREVWNGSALKRKGQIEISGGKFFLNYDEYNKTNSTKLGKGDAYLDENGFTISQKSLRDEVIKSCGYMPEGIRLQDATYTKKYGDALIEYLDAVNIQPKKMENSWLKSNVKPYAEAQCPMVMRRGRVVQLFGALTPVSNIEGGYTWITVITLPEEFRPGAEIAITAQGSAYNTYALRIQTNGNIDISRHRNNVDKGFDFTPGQWLSISCTYLTNN